jgi:YbgC/YbaW family acyl-CoA thioester hydrolase
MMAGITIRSLVWTPTVALSWLWGLGFFYSIHVTLTYGWLGFLAFATANAGGLFLFGWVLGSPKRDAPAILRSAEGPYLGLFLLAQLCAVAITLFGFAAYLWTPMIGGNVAIGVGVLVLIGCSTGHAANLTGLKYLHIVYVVFGVAAALTALSAMRSASAASEVPLFAFDSRFYGLLTPTLVGFLLGPWTDIQQWRRVVHIRRAGGSARLAYAAGAILFFVFLVINALLAATTAPGAFVVSADGLPGAEASVAISASREGLPLATSAFFVWAVIAAVSTIDSAYEAIRELLRAVTARSASPLLAFIPGRVVSSPLWVVIAALGVATGVASADLSLMYLMTPFATLFAGATACLVCEALGGPRLYDSVLSLMIGLTALLIFLSGYVPPIPALLTIAPLVALTAAAPSAAALLGWRIAPKRAEPPALFEETAPTPAPATVVVANQDAAASFGFDGQWFVVHMIPTYDDTNSVGNVYFANYLRWVGKARELFFNACMPNFDLKNTDFYVLTRSISHDFRRETREFDAVTIRVKIAGHNRKFVTLAHEIHSETHGLLGRGEQSLMFVDTANFHPLDIPRSIVEGFLPYWPKGSPLAVADGRPRSELVEESAAQRPS